MNLKDKLQLLRKQSGYSQEQLADKIGIARQTISKWETGQAVPELKCLILLSDLYGVTIDRIVKEQDECNLSLHTNSNIDVNNIIRFLLLAKKNTYAASQTNTRDFSYKDGSGYSYSDSYIGGEYFAGEEIVRLNMNPVWRMNYAGRVIDENFNISFLKEVLMAVPEHLPFRGPEFYTKGDYHYHCKVNGEFIWFQGYEEIFYMDEKIYECHFHGGIIR